MNGYLGYHLKIFVSSGITVVVTVEVLGNLIVVIYLASRFTLHAHSIIANAVTHPCRTRVVDSK